MTTRRLLAVFAVLLASSTLAACGGDEPTMDYEGTYEVIQHTRNNTGCASVGSAVESGDPYFRLEERSGRLAYIGCSSATECEEFANDTLSLDERKGDVWVKTIPSSSGGSDMCELQFVERRAEPARNGIRLSRQKLEGSYETPDFACTDEVARERADELECSETETIIAVPVGS